ncbi:hypothetical protein [Treponema pedis]|uniref:hypothetical protein n=1 Tax=Treponema pedis TaxID=409322 RepID=UPI00040CAB41|nr:hypothetical protein [Treponema pedis]
MQKLCSKIILINGGKKLFEMCRSELDEYFAVYTRLTTNAGLDCKALDIKKTDETLSGDKHYILKKTQIDFITGQLAAVHANIKYTEPTLEDLLYEYYR